MSYYFSKILEMDIGDAVEHVTEALKKEGFGVLTEIDVKATLKNKLDVDFRDYRILGACNPPFAYQALQSEDKIGTMLPCNVVVQEREDGKVEVIGPILIGVDAAVHVLQRGVDVNDVVNMAALCVLKAQRWR